MTAEIYNIRDYQSKRALDRVYDIALQEAQEFNAQLAVWPDFSAANAFHAPEKDPA